MRTLFLIATLAGSAAAAAQSAPPSLSREEIAALARLQVAINTAHDTANIQLALPKNMTSQAQASLRAKLDLQLADIYKRAGTTELDFRKKSFVINTHSPTRKIFDSVVVAVIGGPLPGTYIPATGPVRATVAVPAGAVGVHIGHVMNGFGDTPSGAGLLATATDEARIAATHATLATRQPTNLEYMKTHAGHVINAIDPSIVMAGPGLKYGLTKAATGVAAHIELAAGAPGASPKVLAHAPHVAMFARNTVARADQILALAQKVQASTTAAEAAALVSQMTSLADQLITGFDVNGDGKIGMEKGEGGLQQSDEHVKLMLAP